MKNSRVFIFVISIVFLAIAISATVMLASVKYTIESPNTDTSVEFDIYSAAFATFFFGMILCAILGVHELALLLSFIFGIFASRSSIYGIRVASYVTLALVVLSFVANAVVLLV